VPSKADAADAAERKWLARHEIIAVARTGSSVFAPLHHSGVWLERRVVVVV
jgi:hypothetical protein